MPEFPITQVKDLSFTTAQENILYDDVLLALAEDGQISNTLRFWESPQYFIVLGRTGKVHDDVCLEAVKSDAVEVLRRSSGGGTVVQGPGCLNFSFIISKEHSATLSDLRKSYQIILRCVLTVLSRLGVEATFKPISDLALLSNEKKFSGNAQRRGRKFILHHGTILYDFDLKLIPRYLTMPKDVPDYRQGRDHTDFVANIPIARQDFVAKMLDYFSLSSTMLTKNISPVEKQWLQELQEQTKYRVSF